MSLDSDKVNILLVDDQPAKLISYEVMLAELGENLIKAQSARAAFEHLLKNEIAVVLIDVCMPELDGFELAAMIREHPRFERTAIIFVSAIHMADDDRLRGYRMGAVDYMPVPVVPDILRAKVKVFVELFRKSRELEALNSDLERRVQERTMQLEAFNQRLTESEKRRSIALAAGQMGSWDWDIEADTFLWDFEQCRIAGVDPDTFEVTEETVRPLVHPEDWAKLAELLAEARAGRNAFDMDLRFCRPDGETRWWAITAAAGFDVNGKLIRISGVCTDITDRKLAEERHTLLAREVDHRAKNALALVQSILRLTRETSMQAYIEAVEGRVAALSHAHNLLSASRWQGADMRTLARDELAPYLSNGAEMASIDGPSITLQPTTAQSLALILHELATNSAKHGALSGKGHVLLSWQRKTDELELTWGETGGPKTEPPKSKGFGLKVIRATVEGQLGGKVTFDWLADGLKCSLQMPIGAARGKPESWISTRVREKPVAFGKDTVLLVEDEPLVGLMMRDALTEIGLDVSGPFGNVADALVAAKQSRPIFAVLDVNLNGEFAYDLADFLGNEGVPFVFVTGYGRESIPARFGSVPVLTKPVDRRALSEVLLPSHAGRVAVSGRI